jgi:16S rRNA processing protein RimM
VTANDWLELGRIGSPYGIKGWVHVQSHTDPPERLLDYPRWRVTLSGAEPIEWGVAESRTQGAGIVARLEGVQDRNRAADLRGAVISVARNRMPALREREYYCADLIGLTVANTEGAQLGIVTHFMDTPGGSVMVVQDAGRELPREHWVPATRAHLIRVDLAAGRIVVDWPADMDVA